MRPRSYAAFLSYSHAVDGKLAPAIQSALQRFAKPWHRRRAIRVFRDQSSLAVNPGLWTSIEQALSDSEFFILLASPESASSEWVQREINHWLKQSSPNRLLIVLTDGQITWDGQRGDFDWAHTTALPASMSGVFREEPLYLDLRWARTEDQLSLKHPGFHAAMADLSATLRGLPKDEIVGEDIRQHRRTVRLAWSAVSGLAVLAVLASAAAVLFVYQRGIARQRELEARQHLYTAHVNQALIAARSGDMARVERTLRLQIPQPGQADLRGFEWYHLWRLSHRELATYRGVALATVAFSPDGRLVAAAGAKGLPDDDGDEIDGDDWINQGELRVWDLDSGRRLVAKRFDRRVSAIAFSPVGRMLATVTEATGPEILQGNDVMLLNADTGEASWVKKEAGNLTAVAFHPAGKIFATGGLTVSRASAELRGDVVLWGAADGARTHLSIGPIGWVRSLAFSPGGEDLAIAWDRGPGAGRAEVWIWNLARQAVTARLAGSAEHIMSIGFSRDGTRLLAGGSDGAAVWLAVQKQSEDGVLRGHNGPVHAVAIAPNGTVVATGGWDQAVRIWDAKTNQIVGVLPKHANAVDSVAFAPDGRSLATVSDGLVKLWDVSAEIGVDDALRGHRTKLNSVAFSPNGTLLATGGEEGGVTIWNVASHREVGTLELGSAGVGVRTVAFSPDGRRLAATGDMGTNVWEVETRRQEHEDRDGRGEALAFLPDGTRLLVTGERGTLALDLPDLKTSGLTRQRGETVAVAPDGKTFATAWASGGPGESSIWLWNVSTGGLRCELRGHEQGVLGLTFSPDGTLLASGGYDSRVRIWNVNGCAARSALPEHRGVVSSLAFSPDGRTLAVGHGVLGLAEEAYLGLWNTATWEELFTLPAGMATVRSVAFSPTGKTLAAGGDDNVLNGPGKVTLWRAAGDVLRAERR